MQKTDTNGNTDILRGKHFLQNLLGYDAQNVLLQLNLMNSTYEGKIKWNP